MGIPDLIVAVYDADPGTTPEDPVTPVGAAPQPGTGDPEPTTDLQPVPAAGTSATGPAAVLAPAPTLSTTNGQPNIGDRLGSRITDANGAFAVDYEDAEFQIRNPKEKRPDLVLMVLAPEEPGLDEAHRVLYLAPQITQDAGRTEQRLIRLPAAVLTKAGIALPVDPGSTKQDSSATKGKLNQAMDFHLDVVAETQKIAAARVAAVRQQHEETSQAISDRVLESLMGVSRDEARQLRIVMPGESPAPTMYDAVNNTITNTVNTQPTVGYLILTEDEAAPFRDGTGWRDNIPATEIDPILFKADKDSQRPTVVVREDPLAAIRRTSTSDDPFADSGTGAGGGAGQPGTGDGGSGSGGGSGDGGSGDGAMALTDLPAFVGGVVDSVMPDGGGASGRPTPEDIDKTVQGLQLRSGPADVTAFYDFNQLQIAFDYVWQHAIDDGVIDATQQLATGLAQAGGDPVGAVTKGGNPFNALRQEALHVATAQVTLQNAGVAYLAPQPQPNGGGSTHTPPVPPRPPVITPPFGGYTTGTVSNPPEDLLAMLDDLLTERYKFEIFAPGTTNFGLVITFRQEWDPITYQVGELVKTLTLAPKETRKVTSKRVVKTERSVKEMADNQRNRKDETKDTRRSEAEIVQKAQDKTSFNATAKGNYDIGISSGDASTSLTRDAETSSAETKKAIQEAVLSAAQEFKDEHKLEVETHTAEEDEYSETAEISNPNDELTVTYLFYELQRRFHVTQHLHRLTPVVLVAMEVPNPSRAAIDKVLLLHAWVINRVLLDDRYRPALEYLCTRIVGDELALHDLGQKVTDARNAVATLQGLHRDMDRELRAREAAYDAAVEARAGATGSQDSEGVLEKGWDSLFGSDKEQDLQALRMREDLRKDQYERAVSEEKELRMRLDSEIASLTAAQDAFSKANAEHSNHLLCIAGLRAHFKENVLYYMQAIWSYTFKDEIFFQLSSVKVPKLTVRQRTYGLAEPATPPLSISPKPGQIVLEVHADVQLNDGLDPAQDFITLAEIADLDSPIGCKGNLMMFPLKESNPLTDYMMVPYLDTELGLHDPDDLGSWTPEDFVAYARELLAQQKDKLSDAEYQALQNQLTEQYQRIVSSPRLISDEVIVPTHSLYIEALPGAHKLLEEFKEKHREIDVDKARVEAGKLRLESLRYAGRLLSEEFDDPEVDRKIQINGAAPAIVVPTEG
ncbi:hypothetical protein ACIBJF_50615 [Streptomyces sp. NPDC050743]|uniref:hypothetical protein n=1 Tax=Streptomyces sp. NPDC050743 TaxID=3365634 RepID=UPI0037A2293D